MSVQAIAWVLESAPNVKPHLVATLLGLANHADRDGRGAYPSVPTLRFYTRKETDRAVQKDLKDLAALGLIRKGNQAMVLHLPPDRRTVVWDLAMELSRDDTLPPFEPSGRPASKRAKGATDGEETPTAEEDDCGTENGDDQDEDRGVLEDAPENAQLAPGCPTVPDRGELQDEDDQAKQPPGCPTGHPNRPFFEPSLETVLSSGPPASAGLDQAGVADMTEESENNSETQKAIALELATALAKHADFRMGKQSAARVAAAMLPALDAGWLPEDLLTWIIDQRPAGAKVLNPAGFVMWKIANDLPPAAPRVQVIQDRAAIIAANAASHHEQLRAQYDQQEQVSVAGKPSTARELARQLAAQAAANAPAIKRVRARHLHAVPQQRPADPSEEATRAAALADLERAFGIKEGSA